MTEIGYIIMAAVLIFFVFNSVVGKINGVTLDLWTAFRNFGGACETLYCKMQVDMWNFS